MLVLEFFWQKSIPLLVATTTANHEPMLKFQPTDPFKHEMHFTASVTGPDWGNADGDGDADCLHRSLLLLLLLSTLSRDRDIGVFQSCVTWDWTGGRNEERDRLQQPQQQQQWWICLKHLLLITILYAACGSLELFLIFPLYTTATELKVDPNMVRNNLEQKRTSTIIWQSELN